MSSSDAQKSPVHHATEDSTVEPNHTARPGGSAAAGSGTASDAGTAPGADRDRLAEEAARLKARPDTAMGVQGNFERAAALADVRPGTDADANPPGFPVIGGGPGAGDASSGGGAGAGIPGGGTDIRSSGAFSGGDVEDDREKLFPDQPGASGRQGARKPAGDDTAIGKDRDESSYGGPLKIDDPSSR